MTKKHITLYANILPIIIILALILGTGYFLMRDDIKLPKIFSNEPRLERVEGFPKKLEITEERDKKRLVIESEEELNEFLNEIDPENELEFKGSVNFDRELLIAVTSKTLDEEGHKFKIRKIYRDNNDKTYTVSIDRWDPSENCEMDAAKNMWIDFAVIDKTDWKIEFELVKKENTECKVWENGLEETEDGNSDAEKLKDIFSEE